MQQITWLALGYNAPAQPSKNRVYVWRKLKECGAGYFRPGVAILPYSSGNMAQLRAIAQKIREMGGEAVLTEMRFCDARDEAETVQKFRKSSEKEYMDIMRDSRGLSALAPPQRDELLKKLVKRYKKIRSRDFFSTRDSLAQGLTDLADDMERVAVGLGRSLLSLFEL